MYMVLKKLRKSVNICLSNRKNKCLVFYGLRAIFWPSLLYVPLYKTLFFNFWLRPPKAQNLLPKICTKLPISRLVWQIDRRCLGLPGGFRGWPIQWNHAKCCGADPCCHGNQIWARRGDPVAYRLLLLLLLILFTQNATYVSLWDCWIVNFTIGSQMPLLSLHQEWHQHWRIISDQQETRHSRQRSFLYIHSSQPSHLKHVLCPMSTHTLFNFLLRLLPDLQWSWKDIQGHTTVISNADQ